MKISNFQSGIIFIVSMAASIIGHIFLGQEVMRVILLGLVFYLWFAKGFDR